MFSSFIRLFAPRKQNAITPVTDCTFFDNSASITGNSSAFFDQNDVHKRYQPCTLVIADDQISIIKMLRQKTHLIFGTNNLDSPFSAISPKTWLAQGKLTEQIKHLTIIYVGNGELAHGIICEQLAASAEVILITDQNMPDKNSLLGTELIEKITSIKSIPMAIHTSDKKDQLNPPSYVHYISKGDHTSIDNFIKENCFTEVAETLKPSSTSP